MEKFSIKKRMQSFKYAFSGIWSLFRNEHNAWIHLFATIVVLAVGFWVELSRTEWIFIVIAIGVVLITEALNTAIEHLSNSITRGQNHNIKQAKDVSAGAVLIAATTSAIIGLIVFIPHLWEKFGF